MNNKFENEKEEDKLRRKSAFLIRPLQTIPNPRPEGLDLFQGLPERWGGGGWGDGNK